MDMTFVSWHFCNLGNQTTQAFIAVENTQHNPSVILEGRIIWNHYYLKAFDEIKTQFLWNYVYFI